MKIQVHENSVFPLWSYPVRTVEVSSYVKDVFKNQIYIQSNCDWILEHTIIGRKSLKQILIEEEGDGKFKSDEAIVALSWKDLLRHLNSVAKGSIDADLVKVSFQDLGFTPSKSDKHSTFAFYGGPIGKINKQTGVPIAFGYFLPFRANKDGNPADASLESKVKTMIDVAFRDGYILSSNDTMSFPNSETLGIKVLRLQFESKGSFRISKIGDHLYHVTHASNVAKILKEGIVPKAQSHEFTYPERVYLFSNASMKTIIEYAFKKFSNDDTFSLLQLDGKKLQQEVDNGNLIFFEDYAFSNNGSQKDQVDTDIPIAIFTEYKIAPGAIVKHKEFHISDLQTREKK